MGPLPPASAYGPPRPGYPSIRPHFRRPGGFDPFTLLALQNSGSDDNLLPLLLLGGGGLGGHPGKGGLGGLNPLLLSGLLGCKETSGDDCIVPNNDNGDLCGKKIGETLCCVCKKP